MRRILSAWLPHWPLTRLTTGLPSTADAPEPQATVTAERGVRRIAAIAPSLAGRVTDGMPLAHARAIIPDLQVIDADTVADAAALDTLAAWAGRYTPLTAADAPDGLWLDVTGCAHLFGGEEAMLDDLCGRLERRRIPVRAAIAGTTGAAWALSRSPLSPPRIIPPHTEAAALQHQPVAALRLDARTVAALRRVGLRTVGELLRQPRGDLAARFGAAPGLRLDHALRDGAEAIAWRHEAAALTERLAFAEPIGTPEDLARTLALLVEKLCARLEREETGARAWHATFCRTDGTTQHARAATGLPGHDAAHVTRLLAAELDTVDPGFGVDAVILAAADTGTHRPAQADLAGGSADGARLQATLDVLVARLGADRIRRAVPHGSHIPERAVRRVPATIPVVGAPAWPRDVPRPVRLLRHPEPVDVVHALPDDPPVSFRWRGRVHRVRAATGPERIAPEWWRAGECGVRDYYEIENTEGARLWLFRVDAADAQVWFVQGFFG